jgi:hypothetical protein
MSRVPRLTAFVGRCPVHGAHHFLGPCLNCQEEVYEGAILSLPRGTPIKAAEQIARDLARHAGYRLAGGGD